MPNLNRFLGLTGDGLATWIATQNAFDDAETVGVRIAERTTSVVLIRKGIVQAAQNMRIEADNEPSDEVVQSGNARLSVSFVIVLGYLNHPTVTNTNIKRADVFVFEGKRFNVIDIIPNFVDRVMARAEARN